MSLARTTYPKRSSPTMPGGSRLQCYGMQHWADLFTNRQLTALTTFSDLLAKPANAS